MTSVAITSSLVAVSAVLALIIPLVIRRRVAKHRAQAALDAAASAREVAKEKITDPRRPARRGRAAAYDLSAGCTGFIYAVAQAYGMVAAGLSQRALVVGGDLLSRILDWDDRSTLVLFGDGAGAVVLEPRRAAGFLGFELGADGAGGENSGCRAAARGSVRRCRAVRQDERA